MQEEVKPDCVMTSYYCTQIPSIYTHTLIGPVCILTIFPPNDTMYMSRSSHKTCMGILALYFSIWFLLHLAISCGRETVKGLKQHRDPITGMMVEIKMVCNVIPHDTPAIAVQLW